MQAGGYMPAGAAADASAAEDIDGKALLLSVQAGAYLPAAAVDASAAACVRGS